MFLQKLFWPKIYGLKISVQLKLSLNGSGANLNKFPLTRASEWIIKNELHIQTVLNRLVFNGCENTNGHC